MIEFLGVQMVIFYDVNLGRFGNPTPSLNHFHNDWHTQTTGTGNTRELAGEIGKSNNLANVVVTWCRGKWSWFNQGRRISKLVFDNSNVKFSYNNQDANDWNLVDTAVVYAFKENIDFQISVDNLFGERKHYPAGATDADMVKYLPRILGHHPSLSVGPRY